MTVTVSIFNGNTTPAAYSETQEAVTNLNGLVSLQIGPDGDNAAWNSIQWNQARIETAVTLNGTSLGTLAMPLTAVPYALYAKELNPNALVLQQLYSMISADSALLQEHIDTTSAHIRELLNQIEQHSDHIDTILQNYAEIVDYLASLGQIDITSDVQNLQQLVVAMALLESSVQSLRDSVKTNITDIATNAAKEQADSAYLKGLIDGNTAKINTLEAKEQTDSALLGGRLDAIENAGYITKDVDDLTHYTTTAELQNTYATKAKVKQDSIALGALIDTKANAADVYTKAQTDINIHDTADVLRGEMNDKLADTANYALKTSLAPVATTGSYNSLSDKPTIPTAVSQLTNDKNYTTQTEVTANVDSVKENLRKEIKAKADTASVYTRDQINTKLADTIRYATKQALKDTAAVLRGLIPTGSTSSATLNTTNTNALEANSSETLSGEVNLHKVSKTGSYTDLNNKPSIKDSIGDYLGAHNYITNEGCTDVNICEFVAQMNTLVAIVSDLYGELDNLSHTVDAMQDIIDSLEEVIDDLNNTVNPPADFINGKFSVSDTKQVYFSRGNLQATTSDLGENWTWSLAKNQWDYIGNAESNTSINGNGTVSVNGTVDLFGWVGASSTWEGAAKYGISNSTTPNDASTYGDNESENLKSDWGNTIGTGWHTLTREEWKYLMDHHTKGWSTVNGVNGYVIRPNGVSTAIAASYTASDWAAEEAAGSVFLPATGYRVNATINNVGSHGNYWSSSPNPSGADYAYRLYFSDSNLDPQSSYYRFFGYPVRLVKDATSSGDEPAPTTSSRIIHLDTIHRDFVAQDRNTLTGALGGNYKISIADGTTVTLMDATISSLTIGAAYAGITCEGDATILLEGNDTVIGGFYYDNGIYRGDYPGIFIAEGHTLTINGTGSLLAKYGGLEEYAQYASGIGGSKDSSCGNIVIVGGTIYAYGGEGAAGIGGGFEADCGGINIFGGTVYAYGGYGSPAIGCSADGTCGNITINNTVTKVIATKGETITSIEFEGTTIPLDFNKNRIGKGDLGSCGTVTICGTVYYQNNAYVGSGETYLAQSPLIYLPGHALASAVVGDIICSNGLAYAGTDYNILPSGVTAKAKVCYVSGDGHGLALALTDEGALNWNTAISTCGSKTPNITDCTWTLATEEEWNNMISGAGGYTALRDGFTSVGGSNLLDTIYWSSTEDGDKVRIYNFDSGSWSSYWKEDYVSGRARACLAF